MFESFESVVHGISPVGCIDGIWGRIGSEWYFLNALTSSPWNFSVMPADVEEHPTFNGIFSRAHLSVFARKLTQFAQRKGDWATFVPADIEATEEEVEFWATCGWLVKNTHGSYDYTMGFVMLAFSHNPKKQ